MKKTLGFIGLLACSAGMFALPVAAQSRGDYRNNTNPGARQTYTGAQVYTGNAPVYAGAPSYSYANTQRYQATPSPAYDNSYARRDDDRWDRREDWHDRWRRHERWERRFDRFDRRYDWR